MSFFSLGAMGGAAGRTRFIFSTCNSHSSIFWRFLWISGTRRLSPGIDAKYSSIIEGFFLDLCRVYDLIRSYQRFRGSSCFLREKLPCQRLRTLTHRCVSGLLSCAWPKSAPFRTSPFGLCDLAVHGWSSFDSSFAMVVRYNTGTLISGRDRFT
jgi:hypothetical protein